MKRKWWMFVYRYNDEKGFEVTSSSYIALADEPEVLLRRHVKEAKRLANVPSNAVVLNIVYLGEATKEEMLEE